MSFIDLPPSPEIWLPPKHEIIRLGEAETLDRALHRAGLPRHVRRVVVRAVEEYTGHSAREIYGTLAHEKFYGASLGTLLCAARRRRLAGLELAYINGGTVASPGATTANFGTVSFGDAVAGKLVVVIIYGDTGTTSITLDSCSIGGSDGTINKIQTGSGGGSNTTGIFAQLTDAATGNVTATFSGQMSRAHYNLYTINGGATEAEFSSSGDNADPTTALGLNVEKGGVIIAGANNGANTDFTWSGVVTENDDSFLETRFSCASGSGLAAATPAAVGMDWAETEARISAAAASWSP